MKRLRSFVNKMVLIILSATVFAGAFGLSYKAHYCGGHLSGIAFYTELGIEEPVSCGCSVHPTEPSGWPVSIDKKSCCKDESFYSRLIPEYSQNHSSVQLIQLSPAEAETGISYNILPVEDNNNVTSFYLRPPPKAGRDLVLFLSQQRIPHDYSC